MPSPKRRGAASARAEPAAGEGRPEGTSERRAEGTLARRPQATFEDDYFTQFTPDGRPYEREEERLEFWRYIADRIVADIAPRTVLDAGCALGFLVEALRDRGVEAYGVDISEFALARVRPDIRQFTWRQSIQEPLPQRYDLIVCVEVVEHLPPEDGERAIDNLCRFTDDVLFSSTPLDYQETTHLNVRRPEHWAERFAQHGLYRDVDCDPSTWIAPPAARFRRTPDPIPRQVASYERLVWELRLENLALRDVAQQSRLETARRLGLETELERVRSSNAYRVAERMRSVLRGAMPRESRRGRAVSRLFGRRRGDQDG